MIQTKEIPICLAKQIERVTREMTTAKNSLANSSKNAYFFQGT